MIRQRNSRNVRKNLFIGMPKRSLSLVVKYVKGRNPVIKDLEGHVNMESDCDGDVVGAKDELPIVKEGKEEHRAVLITGSFSACVHSDIQSLSTED